MDFKASKKILKEDKRKSVFLIILLAFLTGLLFLFYTYAWFSASLDVKIQFFDMTVSSNSGLFISLDGIDYSDQIEISEETIIHDLKRKYPKNSNQWSGAGLWPISSTGVNTPNQDKFQLFAGALVNKRDANRVMKTHLNTVRINETTPNEYNSFVAFDIFLKNVSGSPLSDNLYIREDTFVDFTEEVTEEVRVQMDGLLNSIRFGFIFMDHTTNTNASAETVQNLGCNYKCYSVIYEPRHDIHSPLSIERAMDDFGVLLIDGVPKPTYAIIAEGKQLKYPNGHLETGIPLDEAHFKEQITMKTDDLNKSVYKIPNGITKVRVYIWIEGQDIDSLETHSEGAPLLLGIDLEKDLLGYE